MTLPILFEDAEALVIDKPAGMATSRPRNGDESLDDLLAGMRFGYARDPAAVHRLDRDTSGCLLLARGPRALKRLNAVFEAGRAEKSYLAILSGEVEGEAGTIDLALAKVSNRVAGWHMVARADGKAARTDWCVLARAPGRTLVRLDPATGRTHQLRVHMAEGLGAPILGDPVYGRNEAGGLMLHAWRLAVPRSGRPAVRAEAMLPARFVAAGFAGVEDRLPAPHM